MSIKLVPIHERVFIRGHTRHMNKSKLMAALFDNHVVYVLNVAIFPDHELARLCREHDIAYDHQPLSDSKSVKVLVVHRLVNKVVEFMSIGSVVIHCDSGWNRSALIAVLAVSKATNTSARSVIEQVRKVRPKVLKNKRFEEYVLRRGSAQ